jgi:hypothetical protein
MPDTRNSVVGTRQDKPCETGDAAAVLPTWQILETVHVHQVFCQTAIENILSHLTELQETPSLNRIVSQVQNLTTLRCDCQGVFRKAEYDLGFFTTVEHKIDTSEANIARPPTHWTSLNFQIEEASEVLEAQRIRGPT